MNINNQYQLRWVDLFTRHRKNPKILDFGCGSGSVVFAGQKRGDDIYGVDTFYEGDSSYIDKVRKSVFFGTKVIQIRSDKQPFDASTFDLVMANMVFEHIKDLPSVLSEIWRIMKSKGYLLCLFPQKEVFFEGHTKIPIVQKLSKGSKFRLCYTSIAHSLITHNFKTQQSVTWAKNILRWIDNYTYYRPKRELINVFSKYFDIKFIEPDFVQFCLSQIPKLRWSTKLMKFSFIKQLSYILYQKILGMVILAKKI